MDELALVFFPFPHFLKGERREGLLFDWPDRCFACDLQCTTSPKKGLQLCSYGVNYYRFDDDLLVSGVVVRDYEESTSARKKILRQVKHQTSRAELESARDRAAEATGELEAELRKRKDAVIDEYRSTRGYQSEVVELLRPDIARALGQVHDYRQLVGRIIQNVNVIIQSRYPGQEIDDDSLAHREHELVAIYWAARLMEEKLEAALFLLYPERINDPTARRRFRLHGLVTKYLRIYQRSAEAKEIQFVVAGESYGELRFHPRAVGVIPHTFIDNALKYAPRQSEIHVTFDESEEEVILSVSSYGPGILRDEREKIFDLFFRGELARARDSEGTGFGLALAKNVASMMGLEITVSQQGREGAPEGLLWTTFTVVFPKAPRIRRGGRSIH